MSIMETCQHALEVDGAFGHTSLKAAWGTSSCVNMGGEGQERMQLAGFLALADEMSVVEGQSKSFDSGKETTRGLDSRADRAEVRLNGVHDICLFGECKPPSCFLDCQCEVPLGIAMVNPRQSRQVITFDRDAKLEGPLEHLAIETTHCRAWIVSGRLGWFLPYL